MSLRTPYRNRLPMAYLPAERALLDNPAGEDDAYMDAVRRGDMETAQQMVDAALLSPEQIFALEQYGKLAELYKKGETEYDGVDIDQLIDASWSDMTRSGLSESEANRVSLTHNYRDATDAVFRMRKVDPDPVVYDSKGNVIPLSKRFNYQNDIRNPRTRSLQQFPYDYAKYLKDNFPEIWRAGGNIRGNDTFKWWTAYRKGDRSEKVLYWWKTTRPAWIARHFNDHRLPGVIAQIKWGAVGKLGVAGMKRVVEDAIRKRYAD